MLTKAYLLLAFLLVLTFSQSCLSNKGQAVDWFVVVKAPGKSGGFGYFDSKMDKAGSTQIEVVEGKSFIEPGYAVHNTLRQINDNGLQTVAWNDQPPVGDASSGYAHSKALITVDISAGKGF